MKPDEMITKHGLKFHRNQRGYLFKNWCLSLVFLRGPSEYWIQMKIPGVKADWGYKNLYKGKTKPKFRHLGLLSLYFPVHLLIRLVPAAAVFCISSFVGYPLYVSGRLVKAVAYLLMFMPGSAKEEVRDIFSVWSNGIGDLLR